MTSTTTWDSVLTDLATRVDLAVQCLDEGIDLDAALLDPWTPPQRLDPLPSNLLERAQAVNARQVEVQRRMRLAQGEISTEISKSNHAARKASTYAEKDIPKYFDSAV